MAQLQLRPLGVGEIVDATFTVFRRRFGPMFTIALVLVFIPFLISLVGGCSLDEAGFTTCASPIGWLGFSIGVIGSAVASVAAILVAAGAYADVPSGWWRATRIGSRRTFEIILATIVVAVLILIFVLLAVVWAVLIIENIDPMERMLIGIGAAERMLIGIGFVLLIIPGIFLAVSLAVIWQALIIEGVGPMESIKRSWRLVSGERWRVFGAGLLVLVLAVIVIGIVSTVIALILSSVLGVSGGMNGYLVQQVATLLLTPLIAALGTVIYLDLRVRKESLSAGELATALSEQGLPLN